MKLLIITQKVDVSDGNLGFFVGWIEEFAKRCEQVVVICLGRGEYEPPPNVRVLSLGKLTNARQSTISPAGEAGRRAGNYVAIRMRYASRFLRFIWSERHNYDSVFVHMNQVYVLLGALLWRSFGKRVGLWYAHGHTPFSLRLAEKLADVIFTSTQSGCRLTSRKVRVVGQGIDTKLFKPTPRRREEAEQRALVTVGRISPSKDYGTLLAAVSLLLKRGGTFYLTIIGGAGMPEHERYRAKLHDEVRRLGLSEHVSFTGTVQNRELVSHLECADVFLSGSRTGSLDKTLVEAMAMELPIFASNESLVEVLASLSPERRNMLLYERGDAAALAERIEAFFSLPPETREEVARELRAIVERDHALPAFVSKIIAAYDAAELTKA